MKILEVKQLEKIYGKRENEVRALKGVTFDKGKKVNHAFIKKLLKEWGFLEKRKKYPSELSGVSSRGWRLQECWRINLL